MPKKITLDNKLVEDEVSRIFKIAKIYLDLQVLIPDYSSDYLDAYLEIAERLNPDNY